MKKFLSILLTVAMVFALGIPALAADTITSTDSGSNSVSQAVKVNYTPSTTTTDEAKWGASKDSLTGSDKLSIAIDKAIGSADINYVLLQTGVTTTGGYMITGGTFTLDLNGKTVSSSAYGFNISDAGADVTLTDTAGGGEVTSSTGATSTVFVSEGKLTVSKGTYESTGHEAVQLAGGTVVINDGSFTSTANAHAAVYNDGGNLTINGGSFTGKLGAVGIGGGTTTIKGGSFSDSDVGHITYWSGKLDLSSYNGTTAITDLTVYNMSGAVTVSDDTIKLPTGYAFYKAGDADQTTVTELAAGVKYGIKSTSGGTTTTKYDVIIDDTITNGTVTANPTSAAEGDTVTLTLSYTSEYMITSLTITDGNGDEVDFDRGTVTNTYTFTMPASNVTVSATFAKCAKITGVTVNVGGTTYTTGNVTLTPTSGDVTFTLSGTDFANLSMSDNAEFGFRYSEYVEGAIVRQLVDQLGATVDPTANTATYTVQSDDFSEFTGAVEVVYSNNGAANTDGASWTGTGIYLIYQAETTSVGITWGSLTFTYSDSGEGSWSCETGADKVSVTNNGTSRIAPAATYTPSEGYTGISGTITASDSSKTSLAQNESLTYTLALSGAPIEALDGATVGTVTVTIGKASDANAGGIT